MICLIAERKQVSIPFLSQFRDPMILGYKTATSRTRRYGKVGDTFHIFGHEFTIYKITKMKLSDIAQAYYRQEGFSRPGEFMDIWMKLHPRKAWNPNQEVYLHRFEKVRKLDP
jgi:hypothetical protein